MLHPRLTRHGAFQASKVREFNVDAVVCSPHLRALETLKHLRIRGEPVLYITDAAAELNRDELQNTLLSRKQLEGFVANLGLKDANISSPIAF